MPREDFYIAEDDLLPVITATFEAAGAAVDLSGASGVTFEMQHRDGTSKVSAAGTITSATAGEVQYAWTGTDTDTPGLYYGRFKATINSKTLRTPRKLIRVGES